MESEQDSDPTDMTPQTEGSPAPDAMEKAQRDAAEERLQGGGYGG